MSLDEFKEKHNGGVDAEKEAFDELCAMVENLQVSQKYDLNVSRNVDNLIT